MLRSNAVIFGAWDKNTEGSRSLILSEAWAKNRAGRKNPAYPQSRGHILFVVGGNCYASDDAVPTSIAEEVSTHERFVEGAAKTIAVNAYERNSKARSACIKDYRAVCAVCNFNFEAAYGAIGCPLI